MPAVAVVGRPRSSGVFSTTSAIVRLCVAVAGLSVSVLPGASTKHTSLTTTKPSFTVDYEKNEFLMDGQVFRYVSGSLHYFRVPKPYWKDRIHKMKAAGLNAISTYVEWSLHEPHPGVYDFEEMADLEYFLQLIKDEGMYVLLRPGPYICAERDFGGFPYWLLNVVPTKRLRTDDPSYKQRVEKWFGVLMPMVQPFLYGNGGNIIMVQVENEYGMYACDRGYMSWLRDLYEEYVGHEALLYTTDGCGSEYLACGSVPGVYATVDFGASTENISRCFDCMRETQKRGPLVNSEFYAGWLSHWREPMPRIDSDDVVRVARDMLAVNASFNFYMFHGGTNFGFTAGANKNDNPKNAVYSPQLTSYDYDAPLNEAGDPTEKYFEIKKLLERENFAVSNDVSPVPAPKGDYGRFVLRPLASLFEKITQRFRPVDSDVPLAFESMDVNSGFVMYETTLTEEQKDVPNPVNLTIGTVRDRAIVYLDRVQVSVMPRQHENIPVPLNVENSVEKLSVLMENQGRINFGSSLEDRKGIFDSVTLGRHTLGPWKMIAFPFNETSWLSTIQPQKSAILPALYRTRFTLPNNATQCLDTYLDTTGWKKGVAFVNGINVGRYWSSAGPQVTLYVPATYLVPAPGVNTIVMLELEGVSQDVSIALVDSPILNGPIE